MPESELPLQTGLRGLDFAAIVLYLAVTFGIAVWFSRRQGSAEDFFVGGRRIPWFAVGLSILATLFSTLSYLGAPGEVIKNGIGFYAGYLALPLSLLVVTRLWIPFYMRLGLTSAYEYLERRFSRRLRTLGATLFVLLRMGWMSMVVYAASMALDRVKGPDLEWLPGPDLYWWIGCVGIVAAVYTAVGGIQAVIWTDVLQCGLLVLGALMVIGGVIAATGTSPVDWIRTARSNGIHHPPLPLYSMDLTVRVTLLTAMLHNFFWTICTHGSDQVVLQRYFSTPSLGAARRSYYINVATDLLMILLLSLCGLALLQYYRMNAGQLPGGWTLETSADKLFPTFLATHLPVGCAGLIISAFLCDAIQTLESGANSITAVVTTDLLRSNETGGEGSEGKKRQLGFVRQLSLWIALAVSLNAGFIAYISQSQNLTIIDMMPKFFNLFVGPLAAMFFIGMFLPRCTSRSVAIAVAVGLTVSVSWSWARELVAVARELFGITSESFQMPRGPTILLSIPLPCVTTFLTAALLSLFVEDGRPHPGQAYTWRSILRDVKLPPERS